MTIDPTVLSLAGLGVLTVIFAGGLLGLHLKNRIPGLGFRDNLRATAYLTQYDAALEYHGLRRREVRARVNELRVNLAESAADGGVLAAVHRLGPARVLAAEVAGERLAPSWLRGTLWLAVATAVGVFALAMSTSAFFAAVAPGADATWSTPLLSMTATSVQNGSPTVTVELPLVTLALLLVAFLLGSRVWRLWTGRRGHQVSERGH